MTIPSIPGYTTAELESLTPDELSALESDAGDNADELNEIANEGDADPAIAKPAGQTPTASDTPIVEEDASKAPAYVAEAPADAAAQMEALKAAKVTAKADDKAALKKLMDGDIDFEEYEKAKTQADDAIEAANESINELNKITAKAEISSEMSQQEVARAWVLEIGNLMASAKTEGMDYKGSDSLTKELYGLMRAFGQEASEKGMSDEGLKASKWALAQAHSMMKMRHPEMVKATPAAAKVAQPGAPRHTLTTLNNMPNADRAMGDNDTLAKFGMLEGEDLERAMATMSSAEVEKLMASV